MKKTLLFFLIFLTNLIYAQEDCSTALQVCGNSNISYSPSGVGNVNESLGGCLSTGEHNSIWYRFTIKTSGTLTFQIVPNDPNADYDWAVYGPNVTCSNKGTPIRCNAATVIGVGANTGLNMTSTVTTVAGGGTQPFCKYMDVLAGETYFLYIDNWVGAGSSTVAPFSLTWGGTATLASPFNDASTTPYPFIPPGTAGQTPNSPREIIACANPYSFDFGTLSAPILNGNTNYVISYHKNMNDALTGAAPILYPELINFASTYFYSIHYQDPTNPTNPLNSCRQIGEFKFIDKSVKPTDVSISSCNNNNEGVAIFDLTSANVYSDPTAQKKYYPTVADLNAGTNEILNPGTYQSAAGIVYVKVTAASGCSGIGKITLSFKVAMTAVDANLETCFLEENTSLGTFNLTIPTVSLLTVASKKFYPTLTDALNGTNEINTPAAYTCPTGFVFAKVFNSAGCFAISKMTLKVTPPKFSDLLKDKVICMETTTNLDAGPGFSSYTWSTGETSSSISNVGVGEYWVKLKSGNCTTKQIVKIFPAETPVITSVEIGNHEVKVFVEGGVAPYQYSMDKVVWQDSNVFNNLSRGVFTIYVKDSRNCEPISIEVTVPNIINIITANSDGRNDVVDYSALRSKDNLQFVVFDKYGSKIFTADKFTGYKWDGTIFGKKLPTDTYWFSLTWNENDKGKTPFKYSGWILLKNR